MGDDVIATLVTALASHVGAAESLAASADAVPRRGADIVAGVAALRLAATSAVGEQACAAKVDALSSYVAGLDAERGPLAAALIEAALAAEAELRIAASLPPPARRLRGWVIHPADGPAKAPRNASAAPALPPSVARAYAESYAADDVDLVLMGMLRIVRLLRASAMRGEPRGSLLDAFEERAFALCAWPPPPNAPDDARYMLLRGWLVLRRRRPLAATVLRARVRWSRRVPGGSTPP